MYIRCRWLSERNEARFGALRPRGICWSECGVRYLKLSHFLGESVAGVIAQVEAEFFKLKAEVVIFEQEP